MELEVSEKTSNFGNKPHIKKGYYPAQLVKVEPYNDTEGKPKEGTYGRQIIMDFLIYKVPEEGKMPTDVLTYTPDMKQKNVSADVVIPKFVYHLYKDKKSGDLQTAITPNSKITKILTALGWEFSPENVKVNNLIGNFVEVNINDYEKDVDGKKVVSSTIQGIEAYKGPIPEKKKVAEKPEPAKEEKVTNSEKSEELNEEVKKKIENLKQLNKDGHLTDEALKQATEQLLAQLKK